MHTIWNKSSNKAVITEKCQIFRPAADSSAQPAAVEGPAHAVKSSQQQQRALWVFSNQRGLPVRAELFWILTMPTEIWSRIQLGVCGPPQCWGQNAILKNFEHLLLGWVEGSGGRDSSFWENVSRQQKEIWLDLSHWTRVLSAPPKKKNKSGAAGSSKSFFSFWSSELLKGALCYFHTNKSSIRRRRRRRSKHKLITAACTLNLYKGTREMGKCKQYQMVIQRLQK